MTVFKAIDIQALHEFPKTKDLLAVYERDALKGSEEFFKSLIHQPFSSIGQVFKESSTEDIRYILQESISNDLQTDPFYALWVRDMANLCKTFCEILNNNSVGFQLGTKRGCRRYHTDNVPMRLLVTYAGKGTQWLPNQAADRVAFEAGKPNEAILKDPSAIKYINIWDVAIFRGGHKGILHRTPDEALDYSSIMLRLDNENFWDDIFSEEKQNKNFKIKL